VHTITLATQKGGSGKSTLAIGLAVAALQDGERVFILEVDRQGTVSKWGARRATSEPGIESICEGSELRRFIQLLGSKLCTLAIIDTPGADSALSTDAIRVADLCLIPARPSPADIEATQPTLSAIRRHQKKFAFVLNQTPPHSYRPTRAAADLTVMGILATPYIVQRNDHQDALAAGLGVSEFAPNGRAAGEIRALWLWVKQKLKNELANSQQASLDVGGQVDQQANQNPFQAMVYNTIRLASFPWLGWQ
jgi:chromosome partitioning protein